eukprot:937494-Pyramimonas_sp.AAC.1
MYVVTATQTATPTTRGIPRYEVTKYYAGVPRVSAVSNKPPRRATRCISKKQSFIVRRVLC